MSSLLISRSMMRIFSGVRHILSPRYEVTRIPKLQTPIVNLAIVRSIQKVAPVAGQSMNKMLNRIDSEIRRTGRISIKEVEDLIGELKYTKYASGAQSLYMLRCLGSLLKEELPEVRNKLVQEVWDTLAKYKIPLDISHYNSLLAVYLQNGHEFSPTEFLSTLEQALIEPNRVTYQRLILRYCQLGDIEGASKILEFMKEKELPVNEHVFNSLIIGHARANDMESAHGVLSVMRTSGLTPSAETFMNLMVGYAEKGDAEGLEKVMLEGEVAEDPLQNREYMEIIYALASSGHSQHVPTFIGKLENSYGVQQDKINLIYRLINAGCDEVAYQIFETMPTAVNHDGEAAPAGNFFLKQLIRSGLYSVVTVVQYCQKLKKEGLNMYAMERSLQFALMMEKTSLALALMQVINEDGGIVRPHYFWPVLKSYASKGDKENIFKTISEMIKLEVPVNFETCRKYVLPYLLEKDKDEEPIILQLKECGMTVPNIVKGCVSYYLQENDIISAAQLLSRYKLRVPSMLRNELAAVYVKTGEASAAAAVLRQMVMELPEKDTATETEEANEETEDETGSGRTVEDVGGRFLLDVVRHFRRVNPVSGVTSVLQAMKNQGLSISKESVTALQTKLGEHLTEDIVNLLNDLSSGDLTVQPLMRDSKPLKQLNIEEIENRITEQEIKNQPHSVLLSQLLYAHIRDKNVEKAEETLKKLQATEFPISIGLLVLLVEMYAVNGQLEKALSFYEHLRQHEPESKMLRSKVFKIANAIISKGMVEETFKLLEDNAPESLGDETDNAFCNSFINNVARQGVSADVIQRLFDKCIEYNYTKPNALLCGALVKVHLVNNDLNSAMEAFEKVCTEYKFSSAKHELLLAFIQLGDTEKLQKILDLSIPLHGEMNGLYDLVFAFIECGKIRQAKKIMETPGMRASHARLQLRCKRYLDEGRVTELEHLVAITKDVFDVDRNMMFMYLFQAYKQKKDCEKALGIWTTMQEEEVQPSEDFLFELGQMLIKNGREVPFAIPASAQPPPPPPPSAPVEAKKTSESSRTKPAANDASKLIESLVQESKLQEAAQMAREMLVAGKKPRVNVMKFLINKMSLEGDINGMKSIEEHMDEGLRRNVLFKNRLSRAYIVAGRSEEFIDELSASVDSNDTDVANLKREFPVGGFLAIMENETELFPKVITLVEKYASRGISSPANMLWIHYYLHEKSTEAEEVYEKYLKNSEDVLMFRSICRKARDTNDVNLLPPLMEKLNSRPNVIPSAKGVAYSCWVDVLCATEKYDEALGVIEGSLKSISLQDYNTTALTKVKEGLSLSNKTFPYTIPKKEAKKNRQSSSSSSSSSSSENEGKP